MFMANTKLLTITERQQTANENKQESPSSLYSCACVHVGSCTTRKPVILRCVIYTRRNHAYVTRVVAESVVTNQSRCLELEIK